MARQRLSRIYSSQQAAVFWSNLCAVGLPLLFWKVEKLNLCFNPRREIVYVE